MLFTLFVFLCAVSLLFIFLLVPGESTFEQRKPFQGTNIAHRGLHKKNQSVPENSLAAFTAAMDAGYGIELDLRLLADGEVAVFHDETLERACHLPTVLETQAAQELQTLTLFDTTQKIPLLQDVLALVDGKVPLLLELKPGRDYKALCENTWKILRLYDGDIAIESFDPRIVRWFKKNVPGVLRGQLSAPLKSLGKTPQALAVSWLFVNFLGRPHFIAYQKGPRPFTVWLVGLISMRVCWTVHENDPLLMLQENNEALIFEYYEPEPFYKEY